MLFVRYVGAMPVELSALLALGSRWRWEPTMSMRARCRGHFDYFNEGEMLPLTREIADNRTASQQ